jgi:hypothetical protein
MECCPEAALWFYTPQQVGAPWRAAGRGGAGRGVARSVDGAHGGGPPSPRQQWAEPRAHNTQPARPLARALAIPPSPPPGHPLLRAPGVGLHRRARAAPLLRPPAALRRLRKRARDLGTGPWGRGPGDWAWGCAGRCLASAASGPLSHQPDLAAADVPPSTPLPPQGDNFTVRRGGVPDLTHLPSNASAAAGAVSGGESPPGRGGGSGGSSGGRPGAGPESAGAGRGGDGGGAGGRAAPRG